MLLSIVIVNYNAKDLTLDCIASIHQKTSVPFEIILVDNASVDNSASEVKKKSRQVRVIENQINYGFGKGNNQGISKAEGKYIILLNNDTVLKNDAFDKMVDFMGRNPRAGILTCKLYEPDGQAQKNCRSFPVTPFDTMFGRASLLSKLFPNNPITKKNVLSGWDYNSTRKVDWVSGAAMMVRREVFEKVGLLDENFYMYWEDTDFCKRASEAGWEISYIPDAEIIHFTGRGGGRRSLSLKLYTMFQMHHSAYYYFLKHHYKHPLHPMAVLTFLGMVYLVSIKGIAEIFKSTISLIKRISKLEKYS
jgi:GT2 family glycosyltransferase